MITKFISSFTICLILHIVVAGQTLTAKESAALQTSILAYFNSKVPIDEKIAAAKIDAPSEAFLCLLNIDSIGKIEAIHWLGEDLFKDSAYSIFMGMKVTDFKNWQVKKSKGKTIIIPINVVKSFGWKELNKLSGLGAFIKPGESGDLIKIRGLTLSWPIDQIKKATKDH